MTVSPTDLLNTTLKYAYACVPYYASLDLSEGREPQLTDFPIIDAELVAAQPESFYNLDRFPDFIVTTGGTSGNFAKYFLLNYQESDLAFQARTGAKDSSFFDPNDFDGLGLVLTDTQHGLLLPPGHGQAVVSLHLEVGRQFSLVQRFLQEGLIVRGRRYHVVELFGSITKLRALTSYFRHRGFQAKDFHIRRIGTMAFHASSRWMRLLQDFWQADVFNTYGLTEFSEAVTPLCPYCRGFHMPSTVHTEYLALDLSNSVTSGAALLVLTSLFPYRRCMPLIRYNTGDLIEVLPPCPSNGKKGFLFYGRKSGVLLDRDNRILLSSLDVLDAVDALEDEFPGSITYDEAVATVMSWGSGVEPSVFRTSGYPMINCQSTTVGACHLHVKFEGAAATSDELKRMLVSRVRDSLISVASARTSREILDHLVYVECVSEGTFKREGIPLTLI